MVHPHACGADSIMPEMLASVPTVHPHACGADVPVHAQLQRPRRFIPTRVGQMSMLTLPSSSRTSVHPHACGADRYNFFRAVSLFRFIPTRVGQMAFRACICPTPLGSSPRVWGRCCRRRDNIASRAVHPHACGADCRTGGRIHIRDPVHPHACGADVTDPDSRRFHVPVHPHACGADFLPTSLLNNSQRFIPTRVGQMLCNQK